MFTFKAFASITLIYTFLPKKKKKQQQQKLLCKNTQQSKSNVVIVVGILLRRVTHLRWTRVHQHNLHIPFGSWVFDKVKKEVSVMLSFFSNSHVPHAKNRFLSFFGVLVIV